jgi:hypothetical protein
MPDVEGSSPSEHTNWSSRGPWVVCVRIAPRTPSTGVSTETPVGSVKRKRPPSLAPVPGRRTRL